MGMRLEGLNGTWVLTIKESANEQCWLASRFRAIYAIEKHYRETLEHLESVAADKKGSTSATATCLFT